MKQIVKFAIPKQKIVINAPIVRFLTTGMDNKKDMLWVWAIIDSALEDNDYIVRAVKGNEPLDLGKSTEYLGTALDAFDNEWHVFVPVVKKF